MPRYRCPSCSTVVEAASPANLVCPACGFGGRTPPPAATAAPPAASPYAPPPYPPTSYPGPYAAPSAAGAGVFTPPPPPGYAAPGMPPTLGPPPRASGASVAALILGILTLCVGWIPFVNFAAFVTAILAVVFGSVGIKAANENPAAVGGKGMAVAGLVLGIIGLAGWLLFFLLFAALFGGFGPFAGA